MQIEWLVKEHFISKKKNRNKNKIKSKTKVEIYDVYLSEIKNR